MASTGTSRRLSEGFSRRGGFHSLNSELTGGGRVHHLGRNGQQGEDDVLLQQVCVVQVFEDDGDPSQQLDLVQLHHTFKAPQEEVALVLLDLVPDVLVEEQLAEDQRAHGRHIQTLRLRQDFLVGAVDGPVLLLVLRRRTRRSSLSVRFLAWSLISSMRLLCASSVVSSAQSSSSSSPSCGTREVQTRGTRTETCSAFSALCTGNHRVVVIIIIILVVHPSLVDQDSPGGFLRMKVHSLCLVSSMPRYPQALQELPMVCFLGFTCWRNTDQSD
ncbi:hypothetical protein EYF80_022753 [Liparis tanakae]|uniref:Uncharacterized protein n=1 Tax=Liparis tanakae TaxID=230148 RepID=A0A4Z2HN21_9TELE|nr:hypothetical protein EYF80_022753 [Liparis tanakae]